MKKLIFFALLAAASLSTYAQEPSKTREEEAATHLEQGNAKADANNWKEALNEYTSAIGYDPKNGDAYYHRAMAFQNLKDYRGAIMDYSKAIYLSNGADGASYYGRGMCYYLIGRKSDCCIDLSKASGLGNNDAATAMMNYCN